MRIAVISLLATAVAGCSCTSPSSDSAPDPASPDVHARGCLRYAQPEEVGTTPPALPELSGLAASRRHPEVFWAHNDSNSALELFAIRASGEVLARFTLTGPTAPDVEDVAVGPCGDGSCVFLADIGDNLRERQSVQLIRIPEPEELTDGTLPVEAFPFRYPEGPRDAEALIVDAQGVPWVITKLGSSLGEVYRLEGLQSGTTLVAAKVGELHAPHHRDRATTAADLHPEGERLLLRTYGRVWELRRAGSTRIEDLLAVEPTEVPAGSQIQGEAIAFTAEGDGYLLGSEGAGAALLRVTCAP